GEERGIGRVGAWIAALDIIEAEPVQHLHDGQLVVEREIDAGRLLAVTQGGIEEIEAFALHRFTSQLVVPSLLSMTTTPRTSSSPRRRSLSAQFLAARALRRAAISSLTLPSSIVAALSSTCLPVKPSAFSVAPSSAWKFGRSSACNSAMARGVLRSSHRASSTGSAKRTSSVSRAAAEL